MKRLLSLFLSLTSCDKSKARDERSDWVVEPLPLPSGTSKPYIDVIRGSAADDVWLMCGLVKDGAQLRGAFHYDGKSWRAAEVPAKTVLKVWPSAKDDVWAVGRQGAYAHFDGASWTQGKIPGVEVDLLDVIAFGAHVYVAATGPRIYHYDGESWTTLEPPELVGVSVHEVWGTGPTNVLVPVNRLDQPSRMARWNGRWWTSEAIGPGGLLLLGGTGPNDVWALSRRRQGYHWDGERWTRFATTDGAPLWGLSVASSGEAYAVGDDGLILRWDGSAWGRMASGTDERLLSIYATAGGNAWMGGERLYRRTGVDQKTP